MEFPQIECPLAYDVSMTYLAVCKPSQPSAGIDQGQFEGGDPTGGRGRGGTSPESHSATELPKKGIRSTVAATTRSLILTIFSSLSAAGVTSLTGGTASCSTG